MNAHSTEWYRLPLRDLSGEEHKPFVAWISKDRNFVAGWRGLELESMRELTQLIILKIEFCKERNLKFKKLNEVQLIMKLTIFARFFEDFLNARI